jgi:gamma-glutamyl phosphate reductase
MYHLDQLFIVKLFCLYLCVQEFNQGQNRTMETMMENLKLEREQSKDQMAELVKAIANTPPPVGE